MPGHVHYFTKCWKWAAEVCETVHFGSWDTAKVQDFAYYCHRWVKDNSDKAIVEHEIISWCVSEERRDSLRRHTVYWSYKRLHFVIFPWPELGRVNSHHVSNRWNYGHSGICLSPASGRAATKEDSESEWLALTLLAAEWRWRDTVVKKQGGGLSRESWKGFCSKKVFSLWWCWSS